jgi:pimeloyl-ACP methyl ester carboxylesterase
LEVIMSAVRTGELRALGLRTRVLEAGSSDADEAVVLVHGGPGSADDWDHLLPEVGEFARAVAFDLPGFGAAEKPGDWSGYLGVGWASFIAAALNRLGIKRLHLVAHDMGGDCALTWAVGHPDNFASAVLINTGILIGYRWHLIARLHRVPLVGYFAALTGRMGMRPVLRFYEPRLPKDVIDRWHREYDWGTRRALLRFYNATPSEGSGRTAPELARLDRPALVIWGAENRFVPVEQAERQRESFPSAEVVILENSRHYSHLDSPDRVGELVLPFLRRQLESVPSAAPGGTRGGARRASERVPAEEHELTSG